MTVTKSPRVGLTRWSAGTDPFTRAQMTESFESLEATVALHGQGPVANRPAPGTRGRFWVDGTALSYDNGTAWVDTRPDLSGYYTTGQVDQRLAQKSDTGHTHQAGDVVGGVFAPSRIAAGTANAGTWARGDGQWAPLPAQSLAGLTDVTVTSATTGQVLRWNGTKWVNAVLATGDVNGLDAALANRSLVGHTHTKNQITDFAHTHLIADLPVAASGTSSATQLVRADDSRLADPRVPTGLAGGHLAGSYPNPQVLVVGYADTRNVATVPNDYVGIGRWQLKTLSAIGLTDPQASANSVAFVYGVRASDAATAQAWEYAHTDTGNLFRRRGNTTAWGAWQQVESAGNANVFSNDPRLADARPPTTHNHDDLYYRESEVDAFRKSDRPVGEVTYYYGSKTGMGADWLCMDGSAFDASAYPVLYARLGNSTTLPDATDRILVGASGSAAVGSKRGSWTKTLTQDQMPSHSHYVNDPGHAHGQAVLAGGSYNGANTNARLDYDGDVTTGYGRYAQGTITDYSGTGIYLSPTGGGAAHDITPPVMALWPMIRAR